jgi:hypothetical protein
LGQVDNAINILQQYYSNDDHIFIFDNVTIHTKQPLGSLFARHIPKKAPKLDFTELKEANWLMEADVTGEPGHPVHDLGRKKLRKVFRWPMVHSRVATHRHSISQIATRKPASSREWL